MRTTRNYRLVGPFVLLAFIAGLLAGCGSSPPSRYYSLNETASLEPMVSEKPLVVIVGPIQIARYLKRPQIIKRIDGNQVVVAEFDRWIEPLDQGFQRTLTVNLADDLGSPRVHEFGTKATDAKLVDYRVIASIRRFELDENNSAVLDGQWAIVDSQLSQIYLADRVTLSTQPDSKSYSDMAAALSQLIGEFSEQVAAGILRVDAAAEIREEQATDEQSGY